MDAQTMENKSTGKRQQTLRRFLCAAVFLLAVVSWAHPAEDYKGTLQGFTFDVPNKKGERYARIEGGNATMIPGGLVEIAGIKTQIFCEDGREVVITTDRGTFDKKTKEIKTDAFVTVVSKDIKITGTGCQWNPNNKLIEIKENVKVEMTVDTQGKGF